MSVIYARTSLPHRCGKDISKFKNIIQVRNRHVNCGPWHGVVPIKNQSIVLKKLKPQPLLELSTNHMKFIPRGETKELGIKSNRSWIIV